MMVKRTREELIAACAIHGRSPYNNQTLVAIGVKPPPDAHAEETSGDRWATAAVVAVYVFVILMAVGAVLLTRR